jgi:hypothetical protein
MFVQVIRGHVSDPAQVRAANERWLRDLAPGADGWLGATIGVSAQGEFVALARFESEEAARRNSERPEQDAWWSETAKLFDGDITFSESTDVVAEVIGNPDEAGFVQVMRGRGTDTARAQELMREHSAEWASFRPDILANLSIAHPDDAYTVAIYFTSEAEAREGERKEPPPELKEQMAEMETLSLGEPEFIDLTDPWISSPS